MLTHGGDRSFLSSLFILVTFIFLNNGVCCFAMHCYDIYLEKFPVATINFSIHIEIGDVILGMAKHPFIHICNVHAFNIMFYAICFI